MPSADRAFSQSSRRSVLKTSPTLGQRPSRRAPRRQHKLGAPHSPTQRRPAARGRRPAGRSHTHDSSISVWSAGDGVTCALRSSPGPRVGGSIGAFQRPQPAPQRHLARSLPGGRWRDGLLAVSGTETESCPRSSATGPSAAGDRPRACCSSWSARTTSTTGSIW